MEVDAFLCSFRFASIGRHVIEIAFLCMAFLGIIFGDSPSLVGIAGAYLGISLVADMLYRERMRMLHALLSTPELPTIVRNAGDVVNTDKLFHPIYAGVLLLFAIFKLSLAAVFASQITLEGLPRSIILIDGIGLAAVIANACAIVSEVAMLVVIGRRHEHKLVSTVTGLSLVDAKDSNRSFCTWRFVLEDTRKSMPTCGVPTA